jgi:hypothetical protein
LTIHSLSAADAARPSERKLRLAVCGAAGSPGITRLKDYAGKTRSAGDDIE